MGFIGYILFTEPGLKWIFDRAVQMVPGKLSAGKIQGRLMGPFEIQALKFSDIATSVSIETLKIEWVPLDLFLLKNLRVSRMGMEGVRVETFQTEKQERVSLPPAAEFKVPLGLVLDHGLIREVSLVQFENPSPILVNEIFLKAEWDRKKLKIKNVRVKAPKVDLDIKGTVNTHDDFPMSLKVIWSVRLEKDLSLEGGGVLEGSLKKLEITQEALSPFKASLSINVSDLMEEVRWKGFLVVEKFPLQKVNVQWPGVFLGGEFHTEGNLSHFDLSGAIQGHDPMFVGDFEVNLLGNQQQGHWELEQLLLTLPKSETMINMKGVWSPQNPQEVFMLEGTWESLVWPILGDQVEFQSPQGNFKIQGAFEDYRLQIGTSVRYGKIPGSSWNVGGNGNLKGLSFMIESGKLLQAEIRGKGKLKWDPRVEWEITLNGQGFNPEEIYPEWPGKFELAGSASGFQDKDQRQFKIDLHSIKGDLRGRPIGGKAHLEINGEQYSLSEMSLQSGTVTLSGSGTLTERWDVFWKVDAETLEDLLPEAEGSLKGKGKITGFRKTPKITTQMKGEHLRLGAYGVQDVTWDVAIDLADIEGSRIDLIGKGFAISSDEIKVFSLKGRGKMESHDLSLEIATPKDSILLFSKGGYHDHRWSGYISKAEVETMNYGKWFLQQPGETQVSLKKATTSDLCWAKEASRICFNLNWEDTLGFQGTVQIFKLPLNLFKSLLPPPVGFGRNIKWPNRGPLSRWNSSKRRSKMECFKRGSFL
jgi:autotransporter translocation and assembly factor TamB